MKKHSFWILQSLNFDQTLGQENLSEQLNPGFIQNDTDQWGICDAGIKKFCQTEREVSQVKQIEGVVGSCQMYLSKLLNVSVQIAKCICPNCKICLSECVILSIEYSESLSLTAD